MSAEMPYQAVPFQAPEGSEILGRVVKVYFSNLESHIVEPVLKRHGLSLDMIQDDQWYPLQMYYDIDAEILKSPSGSSALVAIGKASMANLLSTGAYASIEDYLSTGLNSITTRGYVRNAPPTFGFIVTKLGEKHFQVKSNLPASNETVYGSLWEACRLLKQEGENFVVRPTEGYPGNDICATFEIEIS